MCDGNGIKTKSIKVNYAYNLLYEVFALLTPLLTTPYISRILGAEGIGIYSYTYSIAQYFVLFGNLGISTYGQMMIAAMRDNKSAVSKIFYELFILRTLTMAISLSVYFISAVSVESYRIARFVLSVYVFAAMFDLSWFFRGIESFSKVVLRNFIVKIIMIVMIFTFVKSYEDVYLYIFFVAASSLFGNLTFLFPMRSQLCRVPIKTLSLRIHMKGCMIYFIPTVATSVYTLLDKTMLGFITGSTLENGYYEQAHKIEQILIVTITSLNTIMRSRMSYLFRHGKLNEMKERLNISLRFIMFIAFPMTAGLLSTAQTFIPWFLGNGFEKSVVLLQIFSFLIIIIGLSNCLNTHFLGPSGRQSKNNYVLLVGACFNFLFNLIAIPRYGAVGAACASVLAEFVILTGYLYLIRDFFRATDLLKLGWRYITASFIMILAVLFIGTSDKATDFVLIKQIIIGIIVYGTMLLVLGDPFIIRTIRIFAKKNG